MSTLHIVGVHGIRQGSAATTAGLSSRWQKSVAAALAVTGDADRVGPVEVTVPSYQSAFPKTATRYIRLGPETADAADAPVDEEEEEFILEALASYEPSAVDDAEADDASLVPGRTLGEGWLTPRILRRAHAVDRKVGKGATARLMWLVREAHTYLRDEETSAAVRAKVREALVETGTSMVIAHSLGSVVFYDMLSRGEIPDTRGGEPGVTTLVTCGSPLSWLAVRAGVHTTGGPLAVPAGVEWTNLYASNDYVAKGGGLAHLASGVVDVKVNNGALQPHDVHRYLDKAAVSERILKAAAGRGK
ncbi:hypothetical protein ABT236_32440 [Streptomyces sp. NPDC001523]|uniref:hypothetical protein n=1 Tax=Streptomyces sp. NPDC001523 TaxID=3154383 RepID=UPI00332BA665